jgi:hypothetical protein
VKEISLKKLTFLLTACCLQFAAFSQYWQQRTDYVIDVTLNDKEKTLDAFEKITYYNQSPDTLYYIWFHLWPNAYKNDRTAFSDQLLENGSTKFYFSAKEERGYINRLDFKVDGTTAKTEDHPQHIDIVKLVLPKPLLPKQQITITTPFHVKLPFNFSRGGYDGESFQVTQWYPKPAVYDAQGWHPMPYLDQGEFYSEFGSFDVRITLPKNYVVAATGELQDAQEKEWLQKRKDFSWQPVTTKTTTGKNAPAKKTVQRYPASDPATKTIRYKQDNVHDFAWFADKRFKVHYDTCRLASGRVIEVYTYYTKPLFKLWENSFETAKQAIRFYSEQVGEYPYNVVSVVHGPESFGGGMEYPTITMIAPMGSEKDLDATLVHEIGHNWFYGILASNERDHPWMDEGINTFYENKFISAKYGSRRSWDEMLLWAKAKRKTLQPVTTPSDQLSGINYGLISYQKTAVRMEEISHILGDSFQNAMRQYYEQWKFRHPQPEDFRNIVGRQLKGYESREGFYAFLNNTPLPRSRGWEIVSPLKGGSIKNFPDYPRPNVLFLSPVIGANSYDKLMIGGLVSNYKLPPTNFNFLLAPMYATGSKKFTGLGRLNYTIATDKWIRKTDFFVNASMFSMDEFKDTAGRKLIMQFQKLVPGVKLTFREKKPRSTAVKYLQWKTYLFSEESLRIIPDTVFSGTDTAAFLHYLLPKEKRYLNQLRFVYENYRALYPFDLNLQVEQARDFIRPAFTANYFFNYKEGGLQLRFFAGKFIYIGEKTIRKQFDNDRYFLNMTGPKGYEDYTYSDYFIGRNKFEGFPNQQIMIRDGGFKIRTDLLASKIGKTDNWLAAVNFNTTVPGNINPLSLLPVKIPLRIFLDIGTYAEVWQKDATGDRFLYDLGLHIPLFKETFNIYFPILYNKEYGDYLKSTIPKNRFFKTMSFTINLYNRDLKEINRELEF